VLNADRTLELGRVGPQDCEAAGRPLGKKVAGRVGRTFENTPFRPRAVRSSQDKIRKTERLSPRRDGESSLVAARTVWMNDSIRQEIIGRRMAVSGRGIRGRRVGGRIRRGLAGPLCRGVCWFRLGLRACWWIGSRSGRSGGGGTRAAG
jgi:hypothetical protein